MSNERVTCVVLIGCGLSLEGVAEIDQEGHPGEGGAKTGFEETTEILKWRHQDFPGCPVVLEVQWICLCSSKAGCTTTMPGYSQYPAYHVAQEKYIKCRHLCDQCQWAAWWLESDLKRYWHTEGAMSVGIEHSHFCNNPLSPFPCRCSTWVTSSLEYPLRNSR